MSNLEEQKDQPEVKIENEESTEEVNNQPNTENINTNETVDQSIGGLMTIADELTKDQETNENADLPIENENQEGNEPTANENTEKIDEENNETNENVETNETNQTNENEENVEKDENNQNIEQDNTESNQLTNENNENANNLEENLANNDNTETQNAITNNENSDAPKDEQNIYENGGTKLRICDEEEENGVSITYQSSGYAPNLKNSNSLSFEHPIEFNGENESENSRRDSQSQKVNQPTEPMGDRYRVAPRPNSTKRTKTNKPEVRVETIIDEDRPMSSCSSYSYTYSYSEVEEEITRPVRHRKVKKDYVPDYIKVQLEQTRNQPTQRSTTLSDDKLTELKKKALAQEPLEDYKDEVYSIVLESLIEDRNIQASQENFKECEKLNRAIELVNRCQVEQRKYDLQTESYNAVMDQLDVIQYQLDDFDQQTRDHEVELRKETDKQIDRLLETHQKKLDELQDEWNKTSKMRQYNSASPRLVFLRKQFKQLMRQCKFSEAEETKSMIQKLEFQEAEKARISMEVRFDESVKKLEAKQEEEVKFYTTKGDIRVKKWLADRAKLRESIINKQKKVEDLKSMVNDPDKLWTYSINQQKKNQQQKNQSSPSATTTMKSGFGCTKTVTLNENNANLSRLTSKDFTERENTTLALPPLRIKRNTKTANRKRASNY